MNNEEKIGLTRIGNLAWQEVCIRVSQHDNGKWGMGFNFNSDGTSAMGASCNSSYVPGVHQYDSKYLAVMAGIKQAKSFIEECHRQKLTASGIEAMIEKAYNEVQPRLFD